MAAVPVPLPDPIDPIVDRIWDRIADDLVGVRRGRRRLRAPDHSVQCGVRARGAVVAGIDTTWQFGEAVLLPGRLAFTRSGRGAPTVRLDVVDIVPTRIRYSGPPRLLVSRLITTAGDLDWAVHPQLVEAASACLRA
jgi:hypothetical protein